MPYIHMKYVPHPTSVNKNIIYNNKHKKATKPKNKKGSKGSCI